MNFDKAIIQMPDGREQLVSPSEFLMIPLNERIELMTASRVKFYRDGQIMSPLDAVRRPKP